MKKTEVIRTKVFNVSPKDLLRVFIFAFFRNTWYYKLMLIVLCVCTLFPLYFLRHEISQPFFFVLYFSIVIDMLIKCAGFLLICVCIALLIGWLSVIFSKNKLLLFSQIQYEFSTDYFSASSTVSKAQFKWNYVKRVIMDDRFLYIRFISSSRVAFIPKSAFRSQTDLENAIKLMKSKGVFHELGKLI